MPPATAIPGYLRSSHLVYCPQLNVFKEMNGCSGLVDLPRASGVVCFGVHDGYLVTAYLCLYNALRHKTNPLDAFSEVRTASLGAD